MYSILFCYLVWERNDLDPFAIVDGRLSYHRPRVKQKVHPYQDRMGHSLARETR